MTVDHAALRARIRELVAAGDLPDGPHVAPEVYIGGGGGALCLVCEASGAQVAYTCRDGRGFALHAAHP
jgi:hypothetical protein